MPLPSDHGAGLDAQLHRWASSAPMRELVAAFGGALPRSGLLAWLEDFSAEHWDFRTARGIERHQVEAPHLSPAQRAAVARAAAALGFATPEPPPLRDYDHLLVLGGMARTCLLRAQHAARLINEDGVRAGRVTALGSFRPLGPAEAEALPEPAEFEVDALEIAMRRAFGAGPRVLAAPSSEPGVRRANTADTYRFWAERAGVGADDRVLIVTTSIYVPFQHCDALRLLSRPYGCLVHTTGLASPAGAAPDRYLQEIRSAVRSMRRLSAA